MFIQNNTYSNTKIKKGDIRKNIEIGSQITINTEADSQITLSKKGVIDVQKKDPRKFIITGLREGFVILNPTPLTGKKSRFLISVDRKPRRAKSKASQDLMHDREKNYDKKSRLLFDCNSLTGNRPEATMQTDKRLKCISRTFRINIKTIKETVSELNKFDLNPKNMKNFRSNISEEKSQDSEVFDAEFYLENNSNKKKLVAKTEKNSITIEDYDIREKQDSIDINLNLSLKAKDFTSKTKIKTNLKPFETKDIYIATFRASKTTKGFKSSLGNIPILGIFFKNFASGNRYQKLRAEITWNKIKNH